MTRKKEKKKRGDNKKRLKIIDIEMISVFKVGCSIV